MTLNFGTDNVYFVPEGGNLRIFDIYQMRRLELDIAGWNLYFNFQKFDQIDNAVRTALAAWGKNNKNPEISENAIRTVDSFLQNFPRNPYPGENHFPIDQKFSPQAISMWIRCSDTAQESFFIEDYRESTPIPSHPISFPVIGSVFLSRIGDFEFNVHEDCGSDGFFLQMPDPSCIRDYPLSPDQILPLDEEFFGSFGSSGLGRMVNLTYDAKVCEENLGCTPLFRIGENFFVTLYFHLATNAEFDVLFRIPERKTRYIRSVLSELGFEKYSEYRENVVYKRGESILHFYSNAAGKESFSMPFLPCFILITLHEGSRDPAARSRLMAEFLPRISKW
ncbi:hypothetical protein JW926_07405 [Candidatus Sumerlaeota bacterium]|nr:hypothetical protein [Candidatus Sumerlaeota bacterium]